MAMYTPSVLCVARSTTNCISTLEALPQRRRAGWVRARLVLVTVSASPALYRRPLRRVGEGRHLKKSHCIIVYPSPILRLARWLDLTATMLTSLGFKAFVRSSFLLAWPVANHPVDWATQCQWTSSETRGGGLFEIICTLFEIVCFSINYLDYLWVIDWKMLHTVSFLFHVGGEEDQDRIRMQNAGQSRSQTLQI